MAGFMGLLENFKASWSYERRLKKVQENVLLHPENVLLQVRLADLLGKLKKKKEAIDTYELAAEQFIKKNLFAQAIALKKIIFRLQPPKDDGEQMEILERLYDQMLVYRVKSSMAEEAAPVQTPSARPQQQEAKRAGLQLEPKAIAASAS